MVPRFLDNVEKVLKIPYVVFMEISKDGKFALFFSNTSGSYQLWALDLQKGSISQVSHGDQRVMFARISPDSKGVVFSRDFGGAERHQLFSAPITGEVQEEQISKLQDIRVFDFSWRPSGKEIAFSGSTLEANFLWLFDLSSSSYRMLYKNKDEVFSPAWSKDSKKLAACTKTTAKPRSAELLILDLRTKKAEIYTPKLGSENVSPKWHPKRWQILFRTNAQGSYDLATYDLHSKALTYLNLSNLGRDFPYFDWTNDGTAIWFVAAKNGRTKLYLQKVGERPIELPIITGTISNIKLNPTDSFFIFSWSSLSQPPLLSKLELKTKTLTTIYKPQYDERLPLGKAEFLRYKSFDGLEIPTFMVFVKGLKKPRPCVVWPHGGPWWEVADEWSPAIQALCAGGFHIFCPNFRGSTGYGSEFERMNIKDPGGRDLQDIESGVKYLLDKGFVENKKIAIAGVSYGGFLTYLAMTKIPGLWKAGAAIVGITDWKEMYELSDAAFRSFIEEFIGRPEKNPELFRDRSAINFVHQIKSPILICHSANDSRCPLKPIERFVQKLRELKKPYESHVVEDEGHGPQKVDNLVKQYKHVVAFMLKHLC